MSEPVAGRVRASGELACRLRCKGATVYRYGARREQALRVGRVPALVHGDERVQAHAE